MEETENSETENSEELVLRAITELLPKSKVVTVKEIEEKVELHYLTILKYIQLLEAKGKIKCKDIGTAKVIIEVIQ